MSSECEGLQVEDSVSDEISRCKTNLRVVEELGLDGMSDERDGCATRVEEVTDRLEMEAFRLD